MSSDLVTSELGELATFRYGKFLAKANLDSSGFPVFSGYGIVGYLPTYQFESPQLVIVCRGEGGTGDVKMSPAKCSITNLSIVLTPDESKVAKRLLYWALKGTDTHRLRTGSAQAQIVIGSLEKLTVTIPCRMGEQLGIAAVLDALDDRIALLRETNATLEAIAQALFKSWFVDFDPVRAKQQGLAPAGMGEATAALFPDSFEDSALGSVPKGWRVGALDDLADLNARSWSGRNHPERVQYLDLANVKDNEVAAVSELAFDVAPSRARRALRNGDTIVGTVRPGNRSFAFIDEPVQHLTASTGFAVLSPKVVENTAFVYLAATQDASIEQLAHLADGGAYPAVRPDVVSALACVVPSAEVLRVFNSVARPLLEKVSANQRQAQTLATLRDTLLPRLISGQLRLPEAEALAA